MGHFLISHCYQLTALDVEFTVCFCFCRVICGIVALLCIAGTLLEMFVEDECWKFWVQPFRTGQPSSNGIFSRGSLSRNSGLLQSDSEGAPLLNAFPQLHDAGAAPTSVHIQQPRYKGRGECRIEPVDSMTVPSSKLDHLTKITNWVKLKNQQDQVLLNSFPTNGHTLGFCP